METCHARLVLFDYSGVNGSKGWAHNTQTLLNDGIVQVNHLLKQGVKPENIILYGWSIGGAIASLVADYFHQQQRTVYLFNDRSFSNLSFTAVGIVKELPLLGPVLAYLLLPTIKFALWATGWEMEADQAYRNVPRRYRTHTVLKDDEIIPYYASLHEAGKYSQERYTKSHKFFSDSGHCADLNELNNKDTNGITFFKEFVEKAEKTNASSRPLSTTKLEKMLGF
jgi:pimeloyl-ACP methyl ester carboxylesterase